MAKTLLQLFFAALLLVVLSQSAQAQYTMGYRYHPNQRALLRQLAVQASRYHQPYVARSSCQPTRSGYYRGYRQRHRDNYSTDRRVAKAGAFYERRRVRQQYFDEQRQRKRFTTADVATLREHRDALREVMQINRELAADRARHRQAASPTRLADVTRVNGKILWPAALRSLRFASARTQLDGIFIQRSGYETATSDTSDEIPRLTRAMTDELKSIVREIPPSEYLAAKRFLKQLEVEPRFAPVEALAQTTEKIH